MDKIDKILDLIENPDRYSPDEVDEMMSDPEIKELYEILRKTSESLHASAATAGTHDVDEEWRKFSLSSCRRDRRTVWHQYRAAAIGAVIVTSILAVAMGISISVKSGMTQSDNIAEAGTALSGTQVVESVEDSVCGGSHMEPVACETPIEFENETLEIILDMIAERNGLEVKFISSDHKYLHLYFVWDTTQPVEETIARLNNFERFDISMSGRTIIVE